MTARSDYKEVKLPEEVLLPEGDVFDAIRSSCRELVENSEVEVSAIMRVILTMADLDPDRASKYNKIPQEG